MNVHVLEGYSRNVSCAKKPSRNVSCALRAAHSPYHKDEGFVA
jgi:hypothetical protein